MQAILKIEIAKKLLKKNMDISEIQENYSILKFKKQLKNKQFNHCKKQTKKKNEKLKELTEQIPWSHNILIFSKIKNEEQREWYIEQTAINGWSYDELGFQIKSDLYSRQVLGDKPNNFQNTLQEPQSNLARDMMKDPYILNLSNLKESYIETELERAMVEKIKTVLLELGNGFSFVGNQYKISVDDLVRTESDNPTIGIILCREKTKFSVEYSLRDINKPIGVSSYEVSKILPKEILDALPTEEDLNLHIDINEDEEK